MKNPTLLILIAIFLTLSSCTQEKPEDKSNAEEQAKSEIQEKTEKKDPLDEIDEYANTQLQKMLDFIASRQKIKVNVEATYDVLQKNGQIIEFGAGTEWIIRRPDHVLIDSLSWDGDDRTFYFDGKDITYYDSGYNVYAVAPLAGNLDQAFDYFVDKLDMPLPLTELFSVNHPFNIKEDVNSSIYLGESTINGVDCNEFA